MLFVRKENISFSFKCLFFFTRPAVNVIGVKCIPPTSPSVKVPIFMVLATVEVQGSCHNESCLGFVMLTCAEGWGWVRASGWSVVLLGLWAGWQQGAGSGQQLWGPTYGSINRTPVTSSLVCMQWSCNDLFSASKRAWKRKAGFGICVFNSSSWATLLILGRRRR